MRIKICLVSCKRGLTYSTRVSQMMLWKRGPKNERSHEEYIKIGKAQTFNPDKLAPIHKSTMHFSKGKTKSH